MTAQGRQSDSQLQALHDFYEPLIILRILGPCIGTRSQGSFRTNTLNEPSHSNLGVFLDRLAWACDFEPGGETVCAIAFERQDEGTGVWLVTSHKFISRVEAHLNYILSRLEGAHALSARHLYELEQELCHRCIGIAYKRVKRYSQLFHTFMDKCHDTLAASDPLLDRELMNLASLDQTPVELCAQADRFRDGESLKRLSHRVSTTTSPSIWSFLRHYVGRLGSWHRASRTLVDFASKRPDLFETIKLQALSTPKSIHAPLADDLTTLESALSRMYPAADQSSLRQSVQILQRLHHFDLDSSFRDAYRDKTFKPRVHAEAYLLEHFYAEKLSFVVDNKYIGCSKPSCYCCNLYFQNHPGGFAQRPTHGNVWTNWQLPLQQDTQKGAHHDNIVTAMIVKFREDLKVRLSTSSASQARVPDSTTGLTPSNG